jgi:hypothetical protein
MGDHELLWGMFGFLLGVGFQMLVWLLKSLGRPERPPPPVKPPGPRPPSVND